MNNYNETEKQAVWYLGNGKIDEVAFIEYFRKIVPMLCVEGKLIGINGEIDLSALRYKIISEIRPYIPTNVVKKADQLIESAKALCYCPDDFVDKWHIHTDSGMLNLDGSFLERSTFCRNRFPVMYHPEDADKEPIGFLKFLNELLYEDDIITLQEYLGYCLLPVTKGQKMLYILGRGGEGKSRLGVILQRIFGESMITGSIHRIETDRFFRYNLQNKLLMIDDDAKLEALPSTGYIKSLVTADTPIDVEAKGVQSRSATIYTRFICLANGSPKALYDKTEGFMRRLLILSTKPKDENRVDDPFIAESLLKEKNLIFNWMFKGLRRLIDNDYNFTISDRTKDNSAAAYSENCNIVEFMEDETAVEYLPGESISCAELYDLYVIWCVDNAYEPLKRGTFISWLKDNRYTYNVEYNNNVTNRQGCRVRGFSGLRRKYTAG